VTKWPPVKPFGHSTKADTLCHNQPVAAQFDCGARMLALGLAEARLPD
jgi:hypothetical protein